MATQGGRPLSELRRGSRGVIQLFQGCDRLLDFGFVPGTPFEVLLEAPFGDPLVLIVRGTRLSLRRKDARAVLVAAD